MTRFPFSFSNKSMPRKNYKTHPNLWGISVPPTVNIGKASLIVVFIWCLSFILYAAHDIKCKIYVSCKFLFCKGRHHKKVTWHGRKVLMEPICGVPKILQKRINFPTFVGGGGGQGQPKNSLVFYSLKWWNLMKAIWWMRYPSLYIDQCQCVSLLQAYLFVIRAFK